MRGAVELSRQEVLKHKQGCSEGITTGAGVQLDINFANIIDVFLV